MTENKAKSNQIKRLLADKFDLGSNDKMEVTADLLANTMHYCKFNGVDFKSALNIAYGHFEAEA